MSEFTVTVFRFAFFVILWLFVFGVAGVLRRDIFGAKRGTHKPRKAKNSQDSARQSAPAPSRPAPQPRPTPAPPRANPGSIRVTAGPLAGTSLILSRGGAWVLEDLSSTNGTFVDGSKITAPFDLGIGNQITIGHTTLETQS